MSGRRWLAPALVVLVVFCQQVAYVVALGDSLSPIADPYSEANALRAAEAYAERGFYGDYGLPRIGWGNRFPETGVELDGNVVYTHYPPGPDLLAGVSTKLFGEHRIGLHRIAPLLVGLLSLATLAAMLTQAFGSVPAAGLLTGCALAPMFSNMMHGLHYQGYAQSLLLIELGILIRLFGPNAVARLRSLIAALAALGFLQGWLSFDYCFLVTFAPVPLAVLFDPPRREAVQRATLSILALGGGFTLAHALHFAQVAALHGGIEPALADFGGSFEARAAAPTLGDRLRLVWQYASVHAPSAEYFSWALPLALAWSLAFLILNRGSLRVFEPVRWSVAWNVRRRESALTLALAWVVSLLWVGVMSEHATDHVHFVPRHYFVFYFVCLLVPLAGARRAPAPEAAST